MKENSKKMHHVPFLITSDYFERFLKNNPENINRFWEIQQKYPYINKDHSDLHIYPYTQAVPAVLSMGCNNQCEFCPTSKIFKGKIFFGDPELILPHYKDMNVHFLDENFFHNDMDIILPLLKKYNIKWLAMAHYEDVMAAYNKYGEDYLYDCGLRIIEVGLENIALMRKVPGDGVPNKKVEIFYLNLTFLPNETKSSIKETAEWMQTHNLKNPIYHYNGMWYSPGQYYYPYGKPEPDGIVLNTELARVVPTYIPNSFLDEEVQIIDKELVNKYVLLVTSKNNLFNPNKDKYLVRDFIGNDYRKAIWLTIGIRVGGIK